MPKTSLFFKTKLKKNCRSVGAKPPINAFSLRRLSFAQDPVLVTP